MFNKTTWLCASLVVSAQIGLWGQVSIPRPILPPGSSTAPPAPTSTVVAPAVAPDRVVLTVGSITLTAAQFDAIIEGIPEQYRAAARGTGRKPFAENIAKVLVLAQEGKRLKIGETSSFKAQEEFQTMNHLAAAAFAEITQRAQVQEAELRAYYDQHKSDFEQVRARHILVRATGSVAPLKPGAKDLTEEEALAKAEQVRKQLLAGADFAALASKESDDPASAAKGGELDLFGHGQMVPAFDQAAFALKIGAISEPVRTPFGYHLIRVDAREPKPFDAMRTELERRLRPQVAQRIAEDLQKNATVVFDPVFFATPAK